MYKLTSLFLFSVILMGSLLIAQEKPEEIKKNAKEITKKDLSKELNSMKIEAEHPKECECEKCEIHAKMDHSKMMKDKHPENCDCRMCKVHEAMKDGKMVDKKHPSDCKCEICKAHSKMDEKKACGADSKKECCSKDEATSATTMIWNKFCPVKGNKVAANAPTIEYNGKTIGFCCPGCDSKFSENPEKFMKNLSEDGQVFESRS